ncbi:MAG: ComEC/Rec2 family competence protein [Anaerolineae bacterium]|nr:ComEC/Rec2 family competence protein [Anaerolineae bacterium]
MRLVYVALGWTAGILLAANQSTGSNLKIAIWLGLILLAVGAAVLLWHEKHLRWGVIALVAFTLGGLRIAVVPTRSDLAQFNHTGGLTLEGTVVREPDKRDTQTQIIVAADQVTRAGSTGDTSGLVLVRAPRRTDVQIGDRVAVTGLLVAPAEFDTFSYADYLARSGVFSVMRNAAVEVLDHDLARSGLSGLKAQAAQFINRSLPEPQAGLLSGILLGSEHGIAPEVSDAFSRVGASHIIAISGFNMVILSGVIMGMLKRLRVPLLLAALLGILMISLYTLFVGANPAVVRAAVMSSLLVIAALVRRRAFVPASLAFTALLLSLLDPTVLWDVSFQLSFFATLGLALYADPLARYLDALLRHLFPRDWAAPLGGFLAEPLVITLAVQITTLPLIALYFNRLSLVAVVTNLLIVPAQAAILILGILATLSAFVVPGFAQILYWYDLVLLSWTTAIVRALARLPFADVAFYVDPRLVLAYFILLIGVALMQATQPTWVLHLGRFIRQRTVRSMTVFASFATLLLIGGVYFSRPDGKLHVWMLDMGQSNAALIQTPRGAHLLVDGGRYPSRLLTALGDRLPFNDSQIDVLAITQPDENDYGALSAVLSRYTAGIVLTNGQPNLSPAYLDLQAQLAGSEIIAVSAGYSLTLDDGVFVDILNPTAPPDIDSSLDDSALVLRIRYGEMSFLFTGDLSLRGQQALLVAGQWPLADVLQIPQHSGIRALDPGFLAAVQPQMALLQADPAALRGGPDADTLALLGSTPLFRTDQQGTIHVWTDGKALWAEPGN